MSLSPVEEIETDCSESESVVPLTSRRRKRTSNRLDLSDEQFLATMKNRIGLHVCNLS